MLKIMLLSFQVLSNGITQRLKKDRFLPVNQNSVRSYLDTILKGITWTLLVVLCSAVLAPLITSMRS